VMVIRVKATSGLLSGGEGYASVDATRCLASVGSAPMHLNSQLLFERYAVSHFEPGQRSA
jgi:hypothetical protein